MRGVTPVMDGRVIERTNNHISAIGMVVRKKRRSFSSGRLPPKLKKVGSRVIFMELDECESKIRYAKRYVVGGIGRDVDFERMGTWIGGYLGLILWGVHRGSIRCFSNGYSKVYRRRLEKLMRYGLVEVVGEEFRLTDNGLRVLRIWIGKEFKGEIEI